MGTFAGVFTPSIMTILGLVLFLRVGFVVGSVGLGEAILIILLANAISVLTSISLAAIATNLRVKGGGVYYIISRTLGLPFGGAIGLVLFVAQAISVGFYCVGFAEGLASVLGVTDHLTRQEFAAGAVIATAALAWIGANWATRVQYLVMALIALGLLSFAFGALEHWNLARLETNFPSTNGWSGFWIAFAIFFPAVTGFTQGVNMSGDLADPGRSIPRGTALAVGLSLFIYLAVAVLCAASLSRSTLLSDYGAMKSVAVFSPLIDAGLISATLSSALASLLGAPRILQSLAKDRVFSVLQPFATGAGADGNPRRGVILTGGIALAVVALGNLNVIAAVVSMFFVVTYALLNYATYYEARGASPSFRPSLKWYRPSISLLGALTAVGVMLAINLLAGLAAAAIVFGVFQYLKRSAIPARWADGQRSYNLQVVREHLLAANARAEHPRDWRPQILAFSEDNKRLPNLLSFASWIEGNSGLTTVLRILEGKGRRIRRAREEMEQELAEELRASGSRAFPLAVAAPDLDAAVQVAVQSVGVGPTRINTLLVNWPATKTEADTSEAHRFERNLHIAFSLGRNLLILDSNERKWSALENREPDKRVIDVWWRDNRTGRLMLVLAYLLTRNDAWRGAKLRVILAAAPDAAERSRERLATVLRNVRISAEALVVAPQEDSVEMIVSASAESSIVFVALAFRQEWFSDWLGSDLSKLLERLPLTVLSMAASDVDLLADPDEGEESEQAAARDAYEDARRERDEASRAVEDAAGAREKAEERRAKEPDGEDAVAELARARVVLADRQRELEAREQDLESAREAAAAHGVVLDEKEPKAGPPQVAQE